MDGYGCPTSDETPTGDGTIQDFVNGSICYHNGGIASDCSGIPGDNAQFPVDNYMYHISQAWNVPNSEWKGIHMGEDIGFKAGTPVFAMADGTVVHSQNHPPKPPKKNYGYLVIIEHDIPGYGKICSLYGHLASNIIGKGPVSKGQLIGFIGTYDENGHNPEHLHFGLYPGPYNSKDWIYEGYDPPGHIGDTIRPSDFVNQY
jgi:murein DD-endopeptidase MepM/ murein hydrolase activator NlpD